MPVADVVDDPGAVPADQGTSDAAGARATAPADGAGGGGRWRLRRAVAEAPGLAVLLAVPFVVLCAPLLVGRVFLEADNLIQNLPLRALAGRELAAGHLPLWNHLLFSGTPLLAGFHAAAAYPTTWLFAVAPAPLAWSLNLAVAYDIALAGMYLFLRRQPMVATAATVGAATYALSGYLAGQMVHIDLVQAACWLPWMLLGVHAVTAPGPLAGPGRRRGSVLLGVAVGLALLSGGAEAVLDGVVLVAIYALGRLVGLRRSAGATPGALAGRCAWLALGGGIGLAVGAAQWVPGLAFQATSQRAAATYAFFTSGSLPWRAFDVLVAPFVEGTGHPGFAYYTGLYNLPEVASYVGILPLIAVGTMATRRWRRQPEAGAWWIWYVVAAFGVLASLGNQLPFGRLLFLIPLIDKERLLNRNLLLVDTALAVLGAWFVHVLLTQEGRRPRPVPRVARLRERWAPGERLGTAATCLPLALVALTTILLWVVGTPVQQVLGARVAVPARTHLRDAVLVTAGLAVAVLITAVVLRAPRWRPATVARALVTAVAVDLVLFDAFLLPLPAAQGPTQAQTPQAAAFAHLTAGGRSIIFDPDRFYADDLLALGQTDLNTFTGAASGQGYAALSDGTYSAVTGAHAQEDLAPLTLRGTTWDDLQATTLLSLPSYFLTPVDVPGRAPAAIPFPDPTNPRNGVPEPLAGPSIILPGRTHTWYLGRALTLTSLTLTVRPGGPAADQGADPAAAALTLVGPTGAPAPVPSAEVHRSTAGRGGALTFAPAEGRRAAGVTVTNTSGRPLRVGVPVVETVETGRARLDGPMQLGATPPHWRFTGTFGPFGVFRNTRAHGWAWTAPRSGSAQATVVASRQPSVDGSQDVVVHASGPLAVRRAEAWAEGWRATATRTAGGVRTTLDLPVVRAGLVQEVVLPGAGTWTVTYRYAPSAVTAGLAASAVGTGLVVGWAAVEVVAGRRRRRARAAHGGSRPRR